MNKKWNWLHLGFSASCSYGDSVIWFFCSCDGLVLDLKFSLNIRLENGLGMEFE